MTGGPAVLLDGPDDGPRFLFAHGAGAAMDSPWMDGVTQGLAGAGVRVIRFEFPYMARRRKDGRRRPPDRQPILLDTWRRVLAVHGPADRVVIGGKSMGGRMAALLADADGVAGLACLGYPLHPAGQPERTRAETLRDLRTPTLICQGTRDPLGSRETFSTAPLSPSVEVVWLEDGDHGFKPRRSSGRTDAQAIAEAVAATATFIQTHARPLP